MQEKRREIRELGEFGLIEHLTKNFKIKHKSTILGIGDDAAVLKNEEDKYNLISSDILIENIHFDLSYFPLKHLGYKAIAVNISDICAMNGTAKQIIVSIGISNRFSIEALEELYKGIELACDEYNLDLIGGDTSASASGLIISVTIIGEGDKDTITKRSGAKINDIICVSGTLGGAYLGLKKLTLEKNIFLEDTTIQPELDEYKYVIQKQLLPKARIDIVNMLKKLNIVPTSMIDISDGLASELLHISKMSNVGIGIFEDKIPIDPEVEVIAEKLNLNPLICAFNGGEDYELLFTISPKNYEVLKSETNISFIGYITEKEKNNYLISKSGEHIKIEAQGWNHFTND